MRPLCKPDENQRILFNGHKRVHGIKFQSVVASNGLIASLFGPVEGRRHDSGVLVDSGLLQELSNYSFAPDGTPLCVYGDPTTTTTTTTEFFSPHNIQERKIYNNSTDKDRGAGCPK